MLPDRLSTDSKRLTLVVDSSFADHIKKKLENIAREGATEQVPPTITLCGIPVTLVRVSVDPLS